MIIQIDTREKARAIQKILKYFDDNGIKHITSKLYVADYVNLENPMIAIDRKQNLLELTQNVCQQHKRFTAELVRANEAGIKVIVLVEHGGNIRTLSDVRNWQNPRLKQSPMAVSGERLYKILTAMKSHYGVDFEFCNKYQTGKRIVELLKGGGGSA